MAENLTDAIRENAEGPEETSADGVRVKRHGLKDQIEADKYLAASMSHDSMTVDGRSVRYSDIGKLLVIGRPV